jgi:hypothetical protein
VSVVSNGSAPECASTAKTDTLPLSVRDNFMSAPPGDTLPPLVLEPSALARAANNFLDGVELLGYVCPPVSYGFDDIARGCQPCPRFAPDRRNDDPGNIHTLRRALRELEGQFNPDRLRHRDPRRIRRIGIWAEAERRFQLDWAPELGRPTRTKWRGALGLAMVVDTIWEWWHLEGEPEGDTDPGNFHPIQLPRGVVRAMRAVAGNLVWAGEDDITRPVLSRRRREPLPPAEALDAAKLVVLNCHAIESVVWLGSSRLAGSVLVSLLDDLREAADLIPAQGWEACVGSSAFQVAAGPRPCVTPEARLEQDSFRLLDIVAATAHQATLPLAEAFLSVPWPFARQAKFNRWGKVAADFFLPSLFLWDDAALSPLRRQISSNPLIPVHRWLAQLDIEAARLRAATMEKTPVRKSPEPQPVPESSERKSPRNAAGPQPVPAGKERERVVGEYIRTHGKDAKKPTVRSTAAALGLTTKAVWETQAWKDYAETKRNKVKKRPIPLTPKILAIVKDHASGSPLEAEVSREIQALMAEQEKDHRADQRRPRKRTE